MSRACACLRRAVCTTACAGCRLHRAQPLPSAPFNVNHPATCSVDCRATMPPPSPAVLLSLWRRCVLRRCAERCSGCKREAACSPRARAHTCQPEAAAATLLPPAQRLLPPSANAAAAPRAQRLLQLSSAQATVHSAAPRLACSPPRACCAANRVQGALLLFGRRRVICICAAAAARCSRYQRAHRAFPMQ